MARTAARPSFQVELRLATERDYGFVERLYVESMRPLLLRLDAWDEADVLGRFRGSFDVTHVRIIRVDGADVGFIQTSETDAEINLDQIHLRKRYRSRGIGSRLIGDLLRADAARNKALSLAAVRGNRALALYQRLGFLTVSTDATKLYMRAGQSITAPGAGSACQP
jgi:GNAT superfamily N-acetyltransferase